MHSKQSGRGYAVAVILALGIVLYRVSISNEGRAQPLYSGVEIQRVSGKRSASVNCKGISRRHATGGMLAGLIYGATKIANAEEIVKFKSLNESPVLCAEAKEGMKKRRGIINIADSDVFQRVPCRLGGYVTQTPYTIEAPNSFQPLTGYMNGGPDPAGQLDLRLESQDFGGDRPVTIVISNGRSPDRKDYPWLGKNSVTDLGNPGKFLKLFAPTLYSSDIQSEIVEIDGVTYYRYELYKAAANYNNRKVISAALYDGDLVCCVGLASESNWDKARDVLRDAVFSFRVGPSI